MLKSISLMGLASAGTGLAGLLMSAYGAQALGQAPAGLVVLICLLLLGGGVVTLLVCGVVGAACLAWWLAWGRRQRAPFGRRAGLYGSPEIPFATLQNTKRSGGGSFRRR